MCEHDLIYFPLNPPSNILKFYTLIFSRTSLKIHLKLVLLFSFITLSFGDYRSDQEKLFNPDISQAKSLACHQCYSLSTDVFPVCDVNAFKYLKWEDRVNTMFVCPPNRNSFCYTEVATNQSRRITRRGCTYSVDDRNVKLKSGCVHLDLKRFICFCNTHLCNV